MDKKDLTSSIIGSAIEVHRHLGPGLLESVYEECLSYELELQGLRVERQLACPIQYKGRHFDVGYRIDLFVNKNTIVELKSIKRIEPIHEAQILTYLRLLDVRYGLILNFNVPVLKQGIRRMLNG